MAHKTDPIWTQNWSFLCEKLIPIPICTHNFSLLIIISSYWTELILKKKQNNNNNSQSDLTKFVSPITMKPNGLTHKNSPDDQTIKFKVDQIIHTKIKQLYRLCLYKSYTLKYIYLCNRYQIPHHPTKGDQAQIWNRHTTASWFFSSELMILDI